MLVTSEAGEDLTAAELADSMALRDEHPCTSREGARRALGQPKPALTRGSEE
jgi:hypothetical protein